MYNSQENCWQIVRLVLPMWKNEQCKAGNEKTVIIKSIPLQISSANPKTEFLASTIIIHALYVCHKTKNKICKINL